MSIDAVVDVFEMENIEPLHKFVLVVLADITNQDSLVNINPEYISQKTCIELVEVKKILNSLIKSDRLLRTAETHPLYPGVPLWKLSTAEGGSYVF